jgi:tetratricopeptide (TPR) repeat protein
VFCHEETGLMSRIAKLRKLLESDPADVFLNFGLAMELLKEDQKEEAIVLFDRILAQDSGYLAAYMQKGNALIALGKREQAKETLAEGIAAAKVAGESHTADQAQKILDSLP